MERLQFICLDNSLFQNPWPRSKALALRNGMVGGGCQKSDLCELNDSFHKREGGWLVLSWESEIIRESLSERPDVGRMRGGGGAVCLLTGHHRSVSSSVCFSWNSPQCLLSIAVRGPGTRTRLWIIGKFYFQTTTKSPADLIMNFTNFTDGIRLNCQLEQSSK